MKNFTKREILQKLISTLLVLVMLISYFPFSVLAIDGEEDENETSANQYIALDVNWEKGEETLVGETRTAYSLDYNIKLNGVGSGFKNVRMTFSNKNDGVPVAVVVLDENTSADFIQNQNYYSTIDFGDKNTGLDISGTAAVSFGDSLDKYNKEIVVTLTADYTDPITKEATSAVITETVKAEVTPKKQVTNFISKITMEKDNKTAKESVEGNYIKIKYGWYANTVTAIYPIHISSYTHTQNLELKVTINRLYKNVSKLSDSYTIDWGGLDNNETGLGKPTEIQNDDGSITYVFTKGTESEDYVKENTFSINKDYTVRIEYNIPNSDPNNGGSVEQENTTCSFKAELNTEGWQIEKEYNKEEEISKKTSNSVINRSNYVGTGRYTPGTHSWTDTKFTTAESPYLQAEDFEKLKTDRMMDFSFDAEIYYTIGSMNSILTGTINHLQPEIVYVADCGEIITKKLNSNEIRLKSISSLGSGGDIRLNTGEEEIVITNHSENVIDESLNLEKFSINIVDFLTKKCAGYITVYTLYIDELGLSDTEIDNIMSITVNVGASGAYFYGGGSASYYNIDSIGNKISYMELEANDFNSDAGKKGVTETKEIKLKMYKNTEVIRNELLQVVNTNPVFYVKLPSQFNYSNIKVSMPNNSDISIAKKRQIKINGEKYIVIQCEGTYNSSRNREIDITISFTRKLNTSFAGTYDIKAYMLTENENYFYESSNELDLTNHEGVRTEKLFARSVNFTIGGSKLINSKTLVGRKGEATIEPNPANDLSEPGEIDRPLIVQSNKQVVFESQIECIGDTLSNVSIISKLPIANNTYLNNSSLQLIESDYVLEDEFYDIYGKGVNGFKKGDTITQVSLQNLTNIKVLKYNSTTGAQEINSSLYKIYYSNDDVVDFNSTNFIEYESGVSDVSKAKNIKIVFNNYEIANGNLVTVQYEMTMPDEVGMVGATTAVQYTKKSNGDTTQLYSPAAYIINGETDGDIVVYKNFEGFAQGVAPEGVNLSNIEFKLQYYDEESGDYVFLKDEQGNDIVALTDEKCVATFSDIPYGEYLLYEVTEFEDYKGLEGLEIINLEAGTIVDFYAENEIKEADIVINKQWEDTNDNQGTVIYDVKRVSTDSITYNVEVSTNDEGIAIVKNAPYGNYVITEKTYPDGWAPVESTKEVTLKNSTVTDNQIETTFSNKLGKGNLQIIKTVPEGETVDGLKFQITGAGKVNYINKQGEEVYNITNMTITVGEDYSSNPDIIVEKSENDTKATITINNLYLGLYNIEEIEIPVLDGTNIKKYAAAKAQIQLNINGKTEIATLKNIYKTGLLEIQKTAKLKEGNTYTDIGDLSSFKVRVTGKSYYGNEIDTVISLDEDGYGIASIEIGKYTVTEVEQEGYTTYYGEDATASTTPPTITINYNKTVTQKLYNEHTGVGYVRVEKTLEGKAEPQKVLDAGIQFKVVGQNVAGGRVEETIKIDKIDTEKNVAYGISGPISSGGEYQLEEVESTVPNFYEGIEPVEIDLKTSHTTKTPLVIQAENTRTQGNLEIITKTEPVGGPLFGITYNVTEVEINKDGTYTKVSETTLVEGSNDTINPSFAELKDIYAGYYLVEQVTVPDGWQKDVSQIIEVPSHNTGYANFEIIEIPKLKENRVTISKEILNSKNEIATSEDFEKAKLNENESFEVKITNIETKKVYYTFISSSEPGVIVGLDSGKYTIEEVYKPKYNTEGYYLTTQGVNEETGLTEKIDNILYPVENSYIFTIEEDSNGPVNVELKIKNIINSDFGFGGQQVKDNYSKLSIEEDIKLLTKAVIYVVDEENNAISGAKFKLVNEEGRVVKLINNGKEFEIDDKKLTITGLPVGKYTLINTAYPDGYLKPEDKEIIVFADAVQVARVEIQKNVPRGGLTISTVYTTEDDETKYVSRSKYKVVDKETGELVKFIRTATGDYRKTNLDSGSAIIVLKSGVAEVEGLEVGTYEVGIVDVTKGYGIQSSLPETVNVVENANENVCVEVINKNIVQIETGYHTSMYLDESGDLYVWGSNDKAGLGNGIEDYYGSTSKPTKVEFPEEVKIAKVSNSYYSNVLALDTLGGVWTWGYKGFNSETIVSPTLIMNNAKDILSTSQNNVILDKDGLVWSSGYNCGDGTSNLQTEYICISTIEGTDLFESLKNGVRIEKISDFGGKYSTTIGLIDSLGRVWTWGYSNAQVLGTGNTNPVYSPICISENTDLKGVKIESLTMTESFSVALDEDGNIWYWGIGPTITSVPNGKTPYYPYELESSLFGNSKIKKVTGYAEASNTGYILAIDENGKVWTWGLGRTGQLGQGDSITYSGVPVCISDEESEVFYGIQIKDISTCEATENSDNAFILAVDSNNSIWSWGGFSNRYGTAGPESNIPICEPRNIPISYNEHLEYNLKFKEVYTSGNRDSSFAIDEEGRLWSWGDGDGTHDLGYYSYGDVLVPTIVDIPGNPKVKKVQSYNNSTMLLSEDGRVYVCGSNYCGMYIYGYSSSDDVPITEITDKFNLEQDEKIIDIHIGTAVYVALDNKGKIYTWGTGHTGRDDNTDATKIACISDNENEALFGKKIVKIDGFYERVLLLDEDGKVYAWGHWNSESYTPICITDLDTDLTNAYNKGIKIVDIEEYYLLDSEGKLWFTNYDYKNLATCICNIASNELYKNYQQDEDYKIVKMYDEANSSQCIIVKDNRGDLWYIDYSGTSKLQGNMSISSCTVKTDLMPKNIISLNGYLLVDEYGQIWVYQNIGNSNGQAGNGTTMYIDEPICLTDKTKNKLYNVKISNILDDSTVVDEKGNRYVYSSNQSAYLNGISPEDYIELNYSTKVLDTVYTDNSKKIILTEDGKIWEGDYTSVKCLSDVEGTELYDAYKDSNFKILKIFSKFTNEYYQEKNYVIFAIDNFGKIWTWGAGNNNATGLGITTYTETPVCLSNIKGTDLFNAHANNSNFKIEEIYEGTFNMFTIAIGNDNSVWYWGYNASTKPTCISTSITSGKIIDIQESNNLLSILYENGDVYVIGATSYVTTESVKKQLYKIGNCEGATNLYNYYKNIIIYGNNKVWSLGSNYYGQVGTGTNSQKITSPQLILENITVEKISPHTTSLIDTDGNLWYWGCNNSVKPTKYLITDEKVVDYISTTENNSTLAFITNTGKMYSTKFGKEVFVKDISGIIQEIYGELNNENISLFATEIRNRSSKRFNILNKNGALYEIIINTGYTSTRDSYIYIESYKKLNGELNGKHIIDYSENKALDSEGNLYVWAENTGLLGIIETPVCTTKIETYKDPVFKANNTLLNVPVENSLNGVEIKELVNDNFAIDTNGDVWYFGNSISAINLSKQFLGHENPFYGKEVAQLINNNYVITTDNEIWYIGNNYPSYIMDFVDVEGEFISKSFTGSNEYYTVLDKNGKIWACGSLNGLFGITDRITQPICISLIKDSELESYHKKDTEFKLIYANANKAIDSNGKLWAWGTNSSGDGTTEASELPKCISDVETTELYNAYQNDTTFKIERIDEDYLIDNKGKIWLINGVSNTNQYQCISNVDSVLKEEHNNNSDFGIVDVFRGWYDNHIFLIGNNGKVYYKLANNFNCVSDSITGITDIYKIYNSYNSSTNKTTYYYIAFGTTGIYRIGICDGTVKYTDKISTSIIKQSYTMANSTSWDDSVIALDEDGQVWYFGYDKYNLITDGVIATCLTTYSTSELYGIEIEDIYYIKDTTVLKSKDGKLYAWGTYANSNMELFTHCDELVKVMLGEEPNNENRIKVLEMLSSSEEYCYQTQPTYKYGQLSVYEKEGNYYKILVDTDSNTIISNKNLNLTKQYLGNGKIEKVLDNSHVQLTDGTILEITETGDSNVITEYTPSTEQQEEIQPIKIEGVNIVKQTKYKALDDNGNLYVWDKFTGLTKTRSGITCLTTTQYDVEPIYSCTNGWSIITNQF